jgi:hypothetical protein
VAQVSNLARSDPTYYIPLKPKITIDSLDGEERFFEFNGLIGSGLINPIYVDCERAANETGTFNLIVEDSNNDITKDHLRNCRVYLEFGKTAGSMRTYFGGFCDIFKIRRPRNNYVEYLMTGPSSKIQFAELLLLQRKSTSKINNPNYSIGQLIRDMINTRKARPLNREDIEGLTNVIAKTIQDGGDMAGQLDSIYFPVVNEVLTTIWDFIDRMAAISGAPWDIKTRKRSDGSFWDSLSMKFPSQSATAVNIKTSDIGSENDDPDATSYVKGPFEIEYNSSLDAGVATRLYTVTTIEKQEILRNSVNNGSTTLTSRAIAQQIPIENDQRRITGFEFIMSKFGQPESRKNRINCDIVMDNSANQPTGTVLSTFKIDLDDLNTGPHFIHVDDVDLKIRFLEGSNKIWVRMFQRSGTDSDPNMDVANTVSWHHNGVFGLTQPAYSAISTTGGGDYDTRATAIWAPTNLGPTYTHVLYSKINRLQARTSPEAAKVLRYKEQPIDSSFLSSDYQTINRYLSLILAQKAKNRCTIESLTCTVPNHFLFEPYQFVNFTDGKTGVSENLQVQRARIVCSALAGEPQIGAMHMELSLGGPSNPLIGDCQCAGTPIIGSGVPV